MNKLIFVLGVVILSCAFTSCLKKCKCTGYWESINIYGDPLNKYDVNEVHEVANKSDCKTLEATYSVGGISHVTCNIE